jgi:hypothetical protein
LPLNLFEINSRNRGASSKQEIAIHIHTKPGAIDASHLTARFKISDLQTNYDLEK